VILFLSFFIEVGTSILMASIYIKHCRQLIARFFRSQWRRNVSAQNCS